MCTPSGCMAKHVAGRAPLLCWLSWQRHASSVPSTNSRCCVLGAAGVAWGSALLGCTPQATPNTVAFVHAWHWHKPASLHGFICSGCAAAAAAASANMYVMVLSDLPHSSCASLALDPHMLPSCLPVPASPRRRAGSVPVLSRCGALRAFYTVFGLAGAGPGSTGACRAAAGHAVADVCLRPALYAVVACGHLPSLSVVILYRCG